MITILIQISIKNSEVTLDKSIRKTFFIFCNNLVISIKVVIKIKMCFFQDTKCGACERDRAGTMVQMYGQPYHPNTLKTVPPDDQASLNRVRIVI